MSRLLPLTAMAAATLYAVQHPFSKPLATFLSTDLGASFEVFIYIEVILATTFGMFLIVPALRQDVFSIISSHDSWRWLAIVIALGFLSLGCYLFAVALLNQVQIAILLNIPLAGALAARIISKRPITLRLVIVSVTSTMIVFAGFILGDKEESLDLGQMLPTCAALLVPMIFAINGQLIHEKFKAHSIMAPIIITNVVGGLAIATFLTGVLTARGHTMILQNVPATYGLLFITGTLAAAVFGRLVYQRAIRTAQGDSGAVGVYFAIIPGVAAAIGYMLQAWLGLPGLAPELWQIVGMPFIVALIWYYEATKPMDGRSPAARTPRLAKTES